MNIDPHLVQLFTYITGFVFLSLVSIIAWLAKGLNEKVENISKGQDAQTIVVRELSKDFQFMKEDMVEIKNQLKEIPSLKLSATLQEARLKQIDKELESLWKLYHDNNAYLIENLKNNNKNQE